MVRTPSDRRAAAAVAVAAALLAGLAALPAQALTVFACEPEWAALARMLQPEARVHTATHARQDPHHIEARPALIAQLRGADLAVCTGATLEAGWLPLLQQRSGNAAVQDGRPGMFYAAEHVELIDPRPGRVTPFDGDVHAAGNPHLHADPRRLLRVAQALSARLQQLEPAQATAVARRHAAFEAALLARIADWERRAAPLRGQRVVVQHSGFGYLWHWLGLQVAADLEPKPGMAPTPGHLQRVLDGVRAQPPLAIAVSSYQDGRSARWLAEQLGGRVPLLELLATVAEDAGGPALEAWFEQLLQALLKAAAAREGAR